MCPPQADHTVSPDAAFQGEEGEKVTVPKNGK